MRRTIKYIPILMSILVSVFMFSVGFSSWLVINPTVSGDQSGSFSAYEVYQHIVYTRQDMFQYSSLHFSNSKREALDQGTISTYYTLYIDECNKEFGSDWQVTFTLSYANIVGTLKEGLFSGVNDGTYSRSISASVIGSTYGDFSGTAASTLTADVVNNGTSVVVTVASSALSKSGTYYLRVDHIFNIPKNTTEDVPSNFRHMFGQYLKNFDNDKTEFITTAEVEKIVKEVSEQ